LDSRAFPYPTLFRSMKLRAAQATVPPHLDDLQDVLSHVAEGLVSVFDELREISRGIHPAILSEGGLELALKALRRRSAVPVELRSEEHTSELQSLRH